MGIFRSVVAIFVTACLAFSLVNASVVSAEAAPKPPVKPTAPAKGSTTTATPKVPTPVKPVCTGSALACAGGTLGGTPVTPKPGTTPTPTPTPTKRPLDLSPGSADCKLAQYKNTASCYNLNPGSADCRTAQWRESPSCWFSLTPKTQSQSGIAFFDQQSPLSYFTKVPGGVRNAPEVLPPAYRGGFSAVIDKYTGRTVSVQTSKSTAVTFIPEGNGVSTGYSYMGGNGWNVGNYCANGPTRVVPNPDSDGIRKLKQAYPIGVNWTDTWTFQDNGSISRSVTYSCAWPSEPEQRTLTCPVWGDGLISGALSNSKGLPLMVNGEPLTVSTPRQWNPVKRYTALGQKRMGVTATGAPNGNASPMLGFSNAADMAFVNYVRANCGDFNYLEAVNLAKCKQISSGTTLSAADCAVIPGNYNNAFKGEQVLCEYTFYRVLFGGASAYEAEGCFDFKPPISKNVQITVYCNNTEVVGKHDLAYNFATCNEPAKTVAQCTWSNGSANPAITDAKGRTVLNGSQVIADGEKYKVTWPAPTLAGARDPWQQWILTSSGGMNPNLAPDDPKQAFFGHYDKTVSANGASGMIVSEGSKKGLPGWTKRDFYFSFFDGAKFVNNALVPFSVEPQFHYYTKKTVKLDLNGGQTITFDAMETCRGKEVTLYPLGGRVTQ
jgi:hypothetical protein